jgi:hypothetical protein
LVERAAAEAVVGRTVVRRCYLFEFGEDLVECEREVNAGQTR